METAAHASEGCFSSLLNEPALDIVVECLERVSTAPLPCKLCLHLWQMRISKVKGPYCISAQPLVLAWPWLTSCELLYLFAC